MTARTRAAGVGAVAALLTATALATLAGCDGSGGTPNGSGGPVSTDAATGTAPPGKYQTLPEPCAGVSQATLHDLLPASHDYAGTETPTYDTDRRAGCRWTGATRDADDRTLSIDFERVVSYDPSVSDEQQAEQDYQHRADAAHIPHNVPDPADSATVPEPGASASAAQDDDGDTSPRRVGGVGDEAYLDDSLAPDGHGSRRDVTMVFRASNVLVTIEFDQWSTSSARPPSSVALQLGAHGLAQELAKVIAQ